MIKTQSVVCVVWDQNGFKKYFYILICRENSIQLYETDC